MPTGYQILNQGGTYFLTFTVVDWIDVFSRKHYRDIMLDSFTYCRLHKGLQVWGYSIMTNHVHCILSARNEDLSNVIRDLKRYTSTYIIEAIQTIPESRRDWLLKRFEWAAKRTARNSKHQFWDHDNHAIELLSPDFINQKLNYIHMNPVRAGWVEEASDWMYSSMRNYCFLPSLIEIDMMDINF